jgi:hypothetical protein
MLKELATFSVLWIIQLFIFACIGYLIFGEIEEYRDLPNTLVLLLQASMGSWDFTIYDDLSIGRMWGILFIVIVIIINMIMLLNFVIAILNSTYMRFSKVKLGLYYDGVVDAISIFKFDKYYGALITAIPPLNILMFLTLPLFLFIKNPRKLRSINKTLTQITYFPIAVFLVLMFVGLNVCLTPLAYLYALAIKIKNIFVTHAYRSKKELV